MGDLLGMESQGGAANLERYKKIISTVQNRVETASALTLSLNQFGHRMDEPVSRFNMNDLLAEEMKLLGRYAGQKQVELSSHFNPSVPVISNFASICQYVFFICFEYMISRFEGPSSITVSTVVKDDAVRVEIAGSGTTSAGGEALLENLRQDAKYGLERTVATLNRENPADGQEKLIISCMSLPGDK